MRSKDEIDPLGSAVGADRPGSAVYPHSPLGESDPEIPTGRDVEWVPLVDYRRNGVSETTIHGALAMPGTKPWLV